MSTAAPWLGLDIGGANLKAAAPDGFAVQVAFPLWRTPERLPTALAELIAAAPSHDGLAITMTGELADCYATKAEGVRAIVDAVEQASGGKTTAYYCIRRRGFVTAAAAREDWLGVAASNWHALATACARRLNVPGLLIDVGSTTSDIVPFALGWPATTAVTDTDRLLTGQLLYQGVGRTPLCALATTLPYRGSECPVAAELFATTADVALLLGQAEPSDSRDTADGRPFTRSFSLARVARMLCADETSFTEQDALAVAQTVTDTMRQRLRRCVRTQLDGMTIPAQQLIVSGAGEWLARSAVREPGVDAEVCGLSSLIGASASTCAPAWAVATLAGEN